MKKFIFAITILFTSLVLVSCNSEKKQMEEILLSALKAPSTYNRLSFEKCEVVHLSDEVEEVIANYNNEQIPFIEKLIDIDNRHISRSQEQVAYYKNTTYYQNKLLEAKKDKQTHENTLNLYKKKVRWLKKLKEYNIGNKDFTNYPTFYVYRLTYESQNGFGGICKDNCYGRFTKNGEMVAIKLGEEEEWLIKGEYYSIPYPQDLQENKTTSIEPIVNENKQREVETSLGLPKNNFSYPDIQLENVKSEGEFCNSFLIDMFRWVGMFLIVFFTIVGTFKLVCLPFKL